MGLKCSLLGHSFEPADFEREREEQGSEVVTVVREIERCVRCGEERVVSESTEVTAVVDEEKVGLDDGADPDDGPVAPDEEILSSITVPEGKIVCTECDFGVDAESSYRDGDPCPDCGAWLTSERNR